MGADTKILVRYEVNAVMIFVGRAQGCWVDIGVWYIWLLVART